jgi:hypothetical protein
VDQLKAFSSNQRAQFCRPVEMPRDLGWIAGSHPQPALFEFVLSIQCFGGAHLGSPATTLDWRAADRERP